MKELLRPSDVAPLLGVSRNRVYQMIQEGTLPAVRIGGAIRIPRAAWERWLARLEEKADEGGAGSRESGAGSRESGAGNEGGIER